MRAATVTREIPLQTKPEIHIVWKVEAARRDTNYRVLAGIDAQRLADDRGIGLIALPPHAIADHGNQLSRIERTVHRKARSELR